MIIRPHNCSVCPLKLKSKQGRWHCIAVEGGPARKLERFPTVPAWCQAKAGVVVEVE